MLPDSGHTVTLRVRARVRPKQDGKGFVNVKYDPIYCLSQNAQNSIGGCYQNSKFTHRGGKILEPLEGANNSKLFLSIFQWP